MTKVKVHSAAYSCRLYDYVPRDLNMEFFFDYFKLRFFPLIANSHRFRLLNSIVIPSCKNHAILKYYYYLYIYQYTFQTVILYVHKNL